MWLKRIVNRTVHWLFWEKASDIQFDTETPLPGFELKLRDACSCLSGSSEGLKFKLAYNCSFPSGWDLSCKQLSGKVCSNFSEQRISKYLVSISNSLLHGIHTAGLSTVSEVESSARVAPSNVPTAIFAGPTVSAEA